MSIRKKFMVIGRDGNHYGPVEPSALMDWLLTARISLDSLVRSESQEEWTPLKDVLNLEAANRATHLTASQNEFRKRLETWLKLKNFDVGVPAKSVDSRAGALAVTAALALLKVAVQHLAHQRVYARPQVKGVNATGEALAQVIAPLLPRVDVLGLKYTALGGGSAIIALFADELDPIELLSCLELIAEIGLHLAEFSMIANNQQGFNIVPLFIYFDPTVYQTHLPIMVQVGYRHRKLGSRWVASWSAFIDVPNKRIEAAPIPGVIGKMATAFNRKPFSLNDLAQVLGAPLER